jgi:hypothetical protein
VNIWIRIHFFGSLSFQSGGDSTARRSKNIGHLQCQVRFHPSALQPGRPYTVAPPTDIFFEIMNIEGEVGDEGEITVLVSNEAHWT